MKSHNNIDPMDNQIRTISRSEPSSVCKTDNSSHQLEKKPTISTTNKKLLLKKSKWTTVFYINHTDNMS